MYSQLIEWQMGKRAWVNDILCLASAIPIAHPVR